MIWLKTRFWCLRYLTATLSPEVVAVKIQELSEIQRLVDLSFYRVVICHARYLSVIYWSHDRVNPWRLHDFDLNVDDDRGMKHIGTVTKPTMLWYVELVYLHA